MNKLTIKDGRIYLDDKKIEGVTEYSVKSSEPIKKLAELNLKLIVSTEEDNEKTAQEGQVQEQFIICELRNENSHSIVKQTIDSIMVELH